MPEQSSGRTFLKRLKDCSVSSWKRFRGIPWRRYGERAIEALIFLCGVSAIIFVFSIFLFVFLEGAPFLFHRFSLAEFLLSSRWIPEAAGEPSYGAKYLILGSVAVSLIALGIAVPFGVGTAVFLSEFCGRKAKEALKVVIELLAAIPSVVWGFIGIMVMNPLIINSTGTPVGLNALNAGIVLSLMIVPVIVSIGEDALRAVPDTYREAAMALGATRWQITYRVLLPAAKNGLLAAVLLGVGRAVGETIAVLMCSGHAIYNPFDLDFPFFHILEPVRALTATIAAEMGEAAKGSEHYQALFVLGLLLFAITFAINLAADLVVKGIRRR